MSERFDPYHRWLGIPPEDQPPNHYRLLGIAMFEDQPDVIEHAADRQMAHLRTFQVGPHAALSQRLLNEVATAKVCLLKPDKKAAYDGFLRGRPAGASHATGETTEKSSPPPFPVAPPEDEPPAVELDMPAEEPGKVESEESPPVAATHAKWWPAAAAGVLALGLVAGIAALALMLTSPSTQTVVEEPPQPVLTVDRPEDQRQAPTVAVPSPPTDDEATADELAFWRSLIEGEWEGFEDVAASPASPQDSAAAKVPPGAAAAQGDTKQATSPAPNSVAMIPAPAAIPAPQPPTLPTAPAMPGPEQQAKRPELKPEPFRTFPQLDPLVADAWTLIRRGDHVKARDKLVQAAKINRDDLRVAFSLGLLDSLVTLDWNAAEKEFSQCVQDHPRHVASLNNLALVRLRLGRESLAVKQWQTALAEGPPPAEIVQNLGRVHYLMQKERFTFKPVTQKALDRLYNEAQLAGASRFDSEVGFQYMGLYGGGNPDFGFADTHDYEDRWCAVCNARGKMRCPRKDCSHGMVTRMASKVIGFNPATKEPIYQSGPIRIPCSTCGGSGWVTCTYCRDGKDKELLGPAPPMREADPREAGIPGKKR